MNQAVCIGVQHHLEGSACCHPGSVPSRDPLLPRSSTALPLPKMIDKPAGFFAPIPGILGRTTHIRSDRNGRARPDHPRRQVTRVPRSSTTSNSITWRRRLSHSQPNAAVNSRATSPNRVSSNSYTRLVITSGTPPKNACALPPAMQAVCRCLHPEKSPFAQHPRSRLPPETP